MVARIYQNPLIPSIRHFDRLSGYSGRTGRKKRVRPYASARTFASEGREACGRNPKQAHSLKRCPGGGKVLAARDKIRESHMRITAPLIGLGLLVASVTACSERAQDHAENTANVIAADVSNAADDVENAAKRLSNKAEAAFNTASNQADNAADATGRALENAGKDLQKK